MKISELIEKLAELEAQYGDVECCVYWPTEGFPGWEDVVNLEIAQQGNERFLKIMGQ